MSNRIIKTQKNNFIFSHPWIPIGVQLKLQNRFSVGLQTLPIRGRSSINRADNFHARMIEIKKHSDHLRSSPDYYVKHFAISIQDFEFLFFF